jgi:hypothetical protein
MLTLQGHDSEGKELKPFLSLSICCHRVGLSAEIRRASTNYRQSEIFVEKGFPLDGMAVRGFAIDSMLRRRFASVSARQGSNSARTSKFRETA